MRGYVSAPRERRSTRDAQYLFVNGRSVRDRLVARALSEGYRSVLPQGSFPAALLFLEVEPGEVDVNVHPAKTEVRFRRASAVAESVRESVRAALASAGFLRADASAGAPFGAEGFDDAEPSTTNEESHAPSYTFPDDDASFKNDAAVFADDAARDSHSDAAQESIEFVWTPPSDESPLGFATTQDDETFNDARPTAEALGAIARNASLPPPAPGTNAHEAAPSSAFAPSSPSTSSRDSRPESNAVKLPPLNSAAGLVREASAASLSQDIRPLGQLEDSFIIATDSEGLLLIDQHVAHERILFDKYRRLEDSRRVESQNLLVPETFDLTPAQAAAFDEVSHELERLGFSLMRLSGRTVAVRATPAELPTGEARNLLSEILDSIDAEKRGRAGETLRERVAASLACRAAIKINTPLTHEKMRLLISFLFY